MIQEFVNQFMANKHVLAEKYSMEHPDSYDSIVKDVIELLGDDKYRDPDPSRIHVIDDGDYQGTLLFVIAAKGYQPDKYWFVKISYGSCSGCDTFLSIRDQSGYRDLPTQGQIEGYMTLALHVVQGLRAMQ